MDNLKKFPTRKTTAACLVGAGVFVLAGLAVTPWESEQTAASYHDALAGHPGQSQVAAMLLHIGYLLFAPAALGMLVLASSRRGFLFKAGAVLSTIGMTTLPGLLVTDAYDLALAQELPREQSAAIADKVSEFPLAALLVLPAIAGTVLGLIAVSAALWKAGGVPGAVPLLVTAGWVVPFVGFNFVLTVAGAVLLLAGFTLAAVRILKAEFPPAAMEPSPAPAAA
jgi:hypothetical protein